jgi:hypothetical protein
MSLLAAFVAMLGKQWLNRYLRHTGGSMIERCGDRQRKSDGLQKWPFRMCMESLPIMLQIALLLLMCGLSRYMWSINAAVAWVIISFTILGISFYIGIVAAGTSSYDCPFQTPASIGLRHLIDTETGQKLLASLSPLKVILLKFIVLVSITWRYTRGKLVLVYHRVNDITQPLLSLEIPPPSRLLSNIHAMARKAGRQTLILLLQVNQAFGNTKQRLVQGIRRFRRAGLPQITAQDARLLLLYIEDSIRSITTKIGHRTVVLLRRTDQAFGNIKQRLVQGIQKFRRTQLLPTTTEGAHHRPAAPQEILGLQVHVRKLENIQKQNADNARCVSWVLRNITDPEAIDSAIRLAGTIRWFNGNPDHDPPFGLIISTFEACFDSTEQLYPAMRDRAYFSARAILQINAGARAQSHERASDYLIPDVPSSSFQQTDPDLHHIICMLEGNGGNQRAHKPVLDFPKEGTNTRAHSLWVSNLFVDLTRVGPNPTLRSYKSYLSAAFANHQAIISNTLLVWYMSFGGHIEEETMWAFDKSYAVV